MAWLQSSGLVRAVHRAQVKAGEFRHDSVGTEHLLLGLLGQEEGIAARALGSLDVTLERVRAEVVWIVAAGEQDATSQFPFTPRAKEVLGLSLREELSLGHNYIGSERILLGIAREKQRCRGSRPTRSDVDAEKIRNEVVPCSSIRARAGRGEPG
ncbi:MAG: hypothetical protein M3071_15145 [Actinomycetota bacterium]|nr:hypothetical protein [Actinomycetota bacterium]